MERPVDADEQPDRVPGSTEATAPAVPPDALAKLFGRAFIYEHADSYRAGVRAAVDVLTDQAAPAGEPS